MTMNWHSGDIAEAVKEAKSKDAIFVVYIEGQDDMSAQLNRFLDDSRVYSKLKTNDFVAVKVQGGSASYTQFSSLYKVVPVPSIFFIGKTGTPLDIATGITGSVEELVAKIDKVLLLAGKQENQNVASTSYAASVITIPEDAKRYIAGAETDVKNDEPTGQTAPQPEQTSVETQQPLAADAALKPASPQQQASAEQESLVESAPSEELQSTAAESTSHEQSIAASTAAAAAERRAAASATTTVTTILPNSLGSFMPNSVSLVPPADVSSQQMSSQLSSGSHVTDVDIRMSHVQQVIEQKKREREEEQRKNERENELRRRREGRESQAQQVITKEQEIKNMQERLRRERQQEMQTRERILAQIAADRAEHATRTSNNADVQSITSVTTATTATVISAEPSVSSANETRLQIRLPGGLTRTKAFSADEPLATVRIYVLNELLAGSDIHEFTLATSYPRREFKTEDEEKTLVDLNLVPNAVLLVLQRTPANSVIRSSNTLLTILTSVFWAILTPAAMAFDYLNKIGFQRLRERLIQMVSNMSWRKSTEPSTGTAAEGSPRSEAAARRNLDLFVLRAAPGPDMPENTQNQDASEQQQPQIDITQSAKTQRGDGFRPKRYGESNIRRLADTQNEDDDKATYNGNSTQQQ